MGNSDDKGGKTIMNKCGICHKEKTVFLSCAKCLDEFVRKTKEEAFNNGYEEGYKKAMQFTINELRQLNVLKG